MVGWTEVSFSVHFYNKVKIKPVSYITSGDNKSVRSVEKANLVQGSSLRRVDHRWRVRHIEQCGDGIGFQFFPAISAMRLKLRFFKMSLAK